MENVSGIYYEVELSNGKTFKASRLSVVDSVDTPNINSVSLTVLDTSYNQAKELSEGVTSIKVKYCRPTTPADYISTPDILKEETYDMYGTNPIIEPYYDFGYIIRFFKITDNLKELEKQSTSIEEISTGIASMYENSIKEV